MSDTELKPCPFCGEYPLIDEASGPEVRCDNSDCGATAHAITKEIWNTRRASPGCGSSVGVSAEDRFWAKVDRSGECWVWTGGRFTSGYGVMKFRGRSTPAHRISWELANGSVPAGKQVLHRCDNYPCVRPDHLFLGNHVANMNDMAAKGRSPNGEHHKDHKLTWEAVSFIRANLATTGTREMARKYGVTENTIYRVRTNKSWKHTPK